MKLKIIKLPYFLIIIVLTGILLKQPPTDIDLKNAFCELGKYHIFGCDRLGRDVFSLFSFGILATFLIAVPARILTLFFSTLVTLLSYTSGKIGEYILDSIASVFLSIPSLLIALVAVYTLGQDFWVLLVSILVSDWAYSYEGISSKVREIRNSGFALNAQVMGGGRFYIFKVHIFPFTIPVLRYLFFTGLPGVIMTISIYSYLGIGISSEIFGPGLGEQISFSKDYFDRSPLSTIIPMLGILLLITAINKITPKK